MNMADTRISSLETMPSLCADVAIVGLGIVGVHQITREVDEVLRRARAIYVVDSGFGIIDHLETICPIVKDIACFYEAGKNRLPTYRRMAAEVLSAALADPPVVFATYGHPRIYCYPTTLIKRAASLLNLRVEVFPGISSLDTMIVDLDFDVATDGLQMFEATDVLIRRRVLQTDVACLLWQCTTVCDPTYPNKMMSVGQVQPLQDYLLTLYPPKHPVAVVYSKTFPLSPSTIRKFPLERLAEEMTAAPLSGTLYIPPVAPRAIQDHALLKSMYEIGGRPGRPAIGPQPPQGG